MHNVLSEKKIIASSAVLALAFIMVMGPSSMAFNAFAQGNDLNQGIGQSQGSTQLGFCVSGENTFISCNNLSVQLQDNEGSNAAAQSSGGDDDDDDGGNSANQGIGQAQDSEQTAACVSGDGTFLSCNNLSIQSQDNTGNNAIAQASGGGDNDDGGNSLNQGIGQSQSSSQSSGVVSGDDSILSGNNVNIQSQNNEGSNAAAQSSGGDDDDGDNHKGKHGDNDDGGNSANQGIGQKQSSEQDSQVVSGDDSVGSGNNINVQDQNNEGSNAAAQQD
ncbi:hypothetical protein YTPLAS21_03250 [Candidatus Nitrosocosmicus sp.]|nr:hypothetical protein YTPLAS21_03250 [Candidatus Nitrosocosmicus sp.]